ncbi:MAG: phosphoribosyltransferase family protein, partial [Sediminibacterium sp.]|nr:phosphoribosyltransferase family protein [Sediminibacterium sp.]
IEHSKNASFLIIDDVINSGKTILYSIKKLIQNFPSEIKLLVLVERMYKNFPIKPDFIGTSLATTLENHIQVKLNNNQNFEVYLT